MRYVYHAQDGALRARSRHAAAQRPWTYDTILPPTGIYPTLPDPPDVEVLSCKVGSIKPEPAIYAHVLGGLQIEPGRVLFVGDTPRADIEGPRAAGMKALHVDELVRAMRPG